MSVNDYKLDKKERNNIKCWYTVYEFQKETEQIYEW